jgi:hypothetical protein
MYNLIFENNLFCYLILPIVSYIDNSDLGLLVVYLSLMASMYNLAINLTEY